MGGVCRRRPGRPPGDREFYQLAYAGPELRRLLTSVGFEVVEEHHWNAVKGLADEVPGLATYLREFLYGPALGRWVKKRRLLNRWFGHKLLFVCRKPAPVPARSSGEREAASTAAAQRETR